MQAIDIIWKVANQLESPEPLHTELAPELTPQQFPTHWVEPYSVKQGAHWYYRYCWMEGRKIHHCHIPGGNMSSGAARARQSCVRSMIKSGWSPELIEQQIQVWRNRKYS